MTKYFPKTKTLKKSLVQNNWYQKRVPKIHGVKRQLFHKHCIMQRTLLSIPVILKAFLNITEGKSLRKQLGCLSILCFKANNLGVKQEQTEKVYSLLENIDLIILRKS